MDKSALRKKLLQTRMELSDVEWESRSLRLVNQFKLWLQDRSFENYILYRSFRREPDLSTLANFLGKENCYYPRVIGQDMVFHRAPDDGLFIKTRWGIEEPPIDLHPLQVSAGTLVVIPAVAYDQRYFRLGYGGGFFDRFLAGNSVATVGVCFDAFVLPQLPVEAHDKPVQHLITESGFS